jgi:hypothetical protein
MKMEFLPVVARAARVAAGDATMDIVEFILARIPEDEALAGAAADAMPLAAAAAHVDEDDPVAQFIGRWNPWRVMSLCTLHRHCVLAQRPIADEFGGTFCFTCDDRRGRSGWPCHPLKLLANDWVEHPEFQPDWTIARRRMLVAI